MNDNTAAIDIGNSNIKIKTNRAFFSSQYNGNFIENIGSFLVAQNINFAIIAAVNDVQFEIISNLLEIKKIKCFEIADLVEKQKIIYFSNISGMGIDRKLGLIGALEITTPPLITVDCGTAITLNYVNSNYDAIGGLIIPGIGSQSKSLNKFTSALPQVGISKITNKTENFQIGKNTIDAISYGLLYSISGGITNIIQKTIEQKLLQNFSLIFAGGQGEMIFKICRNNFSKYLDDNSIVKIEYKPDIVLKGIEKIANLVE